jgi:transglutaminase-like putative cysteine protease
VNGRVTGLRLAQLAVVAVLAGLAGGQFARVFTWAPIAGPVVGAAIGAVVVATVTSGARRRSSAVSALVGVLGFVVLATVAVLGDTAVAGVLPTAETLRALVDGMQNGWARILSTTVPAGSDPSMVLVPVALTWWAAWAAAELVLRSRSTAAPLVPLVVATAVAFAFGVPAEPVARPLVGLTVIGALVLVLLRADPPPDAAASTVGATTGSPRLTARTRRRLAGLPLVALVAVAATAIGPRLPTHGRPVDPRSFRTVTPPDRPVLNPVDQVASRLARPGEPMFTVGFSGGTRPDRLAQVVLDRYDGRTWSTGGRYVTTGRQLPPASGGPEPASPGERVRQDIRIQELDGIWLPAAARPVELSGTDFQFEPDRGVVVSTASRLEGVDYEVVSEVPRPAEDDLAAASFASAPEMLALPSPVPPTIVDAAQEVAPASATALERARSLETYLQARMKAPEDAADAPTGHAYGNLAHLLDEEASGHEGTSEQFATLFAVLARVGGIPSRVVAGFVLPREPESDGRYQVRSGDAEVWPELLFEGVGWVAFDPSPNEEASAREQEREQAGSDRQIEEPVAVDVSTTTTTAPDRARAGDAEDTADGPVWAVVPLSGLLLALAVPPLVKAVRRRRGRRGRPEQRVGRAWHDVVERMAEARVDVPPSAPVTEVVDAGDRAFGADATRHLDPLGTLVNAALFDRRPPDDATADAAWGHADGFRRALGRELGPRRRVLAALDPRPLLRRR